MMDMAHQGETKTSGSHLVFREGAKRALVLAQRDGEVCAMQQKECQTRLRETEMLQQWGRKSCAIVCRTPECPSILEGNWRQAWSSINVDVGRPIHISVRGGSRVGIVVSRSNKNSKRSGILELLAKKLDRVGRDMVRLVEIATDGEEVR
jgi:hypothetical protein